MTMEVGELFPPAQRVFYLKAPLIQVTCQLTFPPLLTIEKELPAAFQERVRFPFPVARETGQPLVASSIARTDSGVD